MAGQVGTRKLWKAEYKSGPKVGQQLELFDLVNFIRDCCIEMSGKEGGFDRNTWVVNLSVAGVVYQVSANLAVVELGNIMWELLLYFDGAAVAQHGAGYVQLLPNMDMRALDQEMEKLETLRVVLTAVQVLRKRLHNQLDKDGNRILFEFMELGEFKVKVKYIEYMDEMNGGGRIVLFERCSMTKAQEMFLKRWYGRGTECARRMKELGMTTGDREVFDEREVMREKFVREITMQVEGHVWESNRVALRIGGWKIIHHEEQGGLKMLRGPGETECRMTKNTGNGPKNL